MADQKSNGYYNDPAMAQAASNLATLFEPPSGSDASGYASARATDLETGQRKAIWDYIQQPGFDQDLYDRAGIVADLFNPDAELPLRRYRRRDATLRLRHGSHDAAVEQRGR